MTNNLSIVILLLPLMIFCHIVDDYYLQGWLASAKQKKWWIENAPNELYKNDYKAALLVHSFSWAFSINLPVLVYALFFQILPTIILPYFVLLVVNMIIHCIVDNLKANKLEINLIADQSIHLCQILISWVVYIFVIL
jgi:hypothetical protein